MAKKKKRSKKTEIEKVDLKDRLFRFFSESDWHDNGVEVQNAIPTTDGFSVLWSDGHVSGIRINSAAVYVEETQEKPKKEKKKAPSRKR